MTMRERFIRRLLSSLKCSVCGQRYETSDVNILGHQEDLWFFSVSCVSCNTQGLVAAVVKEGRATEVVTDLTEEEYSRLAFAEAVTSNDVLDIHNFLKEFDGDFSRLFSIKQ